MTPLPALGFIEAATMLGVTMASDDMPRLVAAINRAYTLGLREGAALERESCAQAADALGAPDCAAAIRARSTP